MHYPDCQFVMQCDAKLMWGQANSFFNFMNPPPYLYPDPALHARQSNMNLPSLLNDHLASNRLLNHNPPWEIRYCDELYERGVFATRDIKPGEVIFRDAPLILGPRTSASKFVCVNCYRVEGVLACSKGCGLPVCSQACESSEQHRRECRLIVVWRGGVAEGEVDRCVFRCLAAIRGLFVDEGGKELLRMLKGHHGTVHGREVNIFQPLFDFVITSFISSDSRRTN